VPKDQDKGKRDDKSETKVEVKGEDIEYYLFLVILKDSKELEDILNTFRDTLSKRGKVDSEASTPLGSKVLKGEDPYRGRILIVPKGNYLVGAAGFKNDKEAEDRLAELIKNMK